MNRREFLTTCACCACASAGTIFLDKSIKNDNSLDNYVVNHVVTHIVEHCNLKCKYCSHFACIAQEEFYDLDKFGQDMRQMSFVFKKQLSELVLLGGEPLLNPNINEYIKISRNYFPDTLISLTTNAKLLNDMDEKFWKTIKENSVLLTPTVYPIKINWASILNKAKKYGVVVYASGPGSEKLTLDNIENYQVKTFNKTNLSKNRKIITENCGQQFTSISMQNGKLYPCMTIAYIRHLNKKFNTNFIVTEDDYIDLYKVTNINEVKKRIMTTTILPFCEYCTKRPTPMKWENSPVHTVDEWVRDA